MGLLIGNSTYLVLVVSTIIFLIVKWSTIYSGFGSLMSSPNRCLIRLPPLIQEYFQPPANCNFCRSIKKIRRETNLKPESFERLYAYNSIPLIVSDAQTSWSAGHVFGVDYFVNLYKNHSHNVEHKSHCQFFPYQSKFSNLEEALTELDSKQPPKLAGGNRKATRNNHTSDPWYFGWSNCDPIVSNELRKHYSKPYFLPKNSYLSLIDWIFMGQPGYGANIHVDRVKNPSWQAQIKGYKRWILLPPMECYKVCHKLDFTVKPGEILILDTNVWFHQTRIVGNEISIVIGTEYD